MHLFKIDSWRELLKKRVYTPHNILFYYGDAFFIKKYSVHQSHQILHKSSSQPIKMVGFAYLNSYTKHHSLNQSSNYRSLWNISNDYTNLSTGELLKKIF